MTKIIENIKEVSINHKGGGPVMPQPERWGTQGYDPKKAVDIFKLKRRHCRWPVRDNERGVADLYCGEAIAYDGCSYCLTHLARSKQSSPQ
jgi:hypothetical protein